MPRDYDIVIVGGGLVGASLACALAPLQLKLALVEAVPFRSDAQPSYDERRLALAQGSKRILETMGTWPLVYERGATPIESIHISDRGHPGFTRLRHDRLGVDALGYVVSARVLGGALTDQLRQLSAADVFCPAQATALKLDGEDAELEIDGDAGARTLRAGLLVLADGGDSKTRAMAGIGARVRDYGQSAVVTTVAADRPHHNRAYERFTTTGPLALLPTTDNCYGVVWTTRTELVDDVLGLGDDEFLARLQERFGDRAGVLSRPATRRAYPLRLLQVPDPVRPKVAVIGNAAHTVHPVAGQGFNLGLRDVAVLADVIADAVAQGREIGELSVLQHYQNWRRADTRAVTIFTDGLIHLFSNDFAPVVLLRGGVMWMVDSVPFLKRRLVRRTMGLAGRLPRLACGVALT